MLYSRNSQKDKTTSLNPNNTGVKDDLVGSRTRQLRQLLKAGSPSAWNYGAKKSADDWCTNVPALKEGRTGFKLLLQLESSVLRVR